MTMKGRLLAAAAVLPVVVLATGLALWSTQPGLASEVEKRGGRVIDEPKTPEGPTVSVVFTARPIADADLGFLRGRRGYQRLFLNSTRVSGEGLENLAGQKDLRWLSLARCPITDDELKHLPSLPDLELLDLNQTPITDAGLAHLKSCKKLRRLFLSRTGVTDAGLEHLKSLGQLLQVDASSTGVTEKGAAELQAAIPSLAVSFGKSDD
jgi:hypothetical protein